MAESRGSKKNNRGAIKDKKGSRDYGKTGKRTE